MEEIVQVADILVGIAVMDRLDGTHSYTKSAMERINAAKGFEHRTLQPTQAGATVVVTYRKLTSEQFEQAWTLAKEKLAHLEPAV